MKKQLPGWAVLLIITLAAGLALGGTYALTKDPIEQQALIKAENARKAALPNAASFEELPLSEGAAVDWVYAGLKDGQPVGYVAQKTVNGFGGKVEVIAGVDTKNAPDAFTIGGITVGGSDFSETAGLGARAKEPAFTDQFTGKAAPVSFIKAGEQATESSVDALTSATITTTAVVNGVNDIVKYVKADVLGIAGVEMPPKPASGVFSASEKGFRGPVYVEAAFDGAGQVTYISVGDDNFAEDIGLGVVEPDFMIQFIGKQMPLEAADIDVISGATISSNAVVKALNTAYAVAGGAEIVIPETPALPEKPAEGVFSAAEEGFAGPVYVEAAFDADGKITYISVGDGRFAETEGFGARALEAEEQAPFIGAQMPLEAGGVDVLTGATFTKTAIVKGLNKAYAASKGEVIEEPAKAAAEVVDKPDTTYGAAAYGFESDVYVEAAFADGKVTYMSIGDKRFAETEGIGGQALKPEFAAQFIGKSLPVSAEDIDGISGATFTTSAVLEALNKAYDKYQAAAEAPAEAFVMPEKPAEGVFSASEQGFAGPVYTEAAFDADGKITYISVGDSQFAETEGFGARALKAENLAPFIGAQMPLEAGSVDALTGATLTKTAIVKGLNKAFAASQGGAAEAPAKEEAPAAEKPEVTFGAAAYGFESDVYVEAAFEDGKVAYMSIGDKRFAETEGIGGQALKPEFAAQFIGKSLPVSAEDIDGISGATFTTSAVLEALNKAYAKYQAAAEVPAEEPAAVPENTAAGTAQGFAGPVAVTAAFDGDGKITYLQIGDAAFAETPGLGARAQEEAFQAQFIGKQMPLTLGDIDAIAGATITSTAVVDALNQAYASAAPAEAPQEAPAEEAAAPADDGLLTVNTVSFFTEIQVKAAFENGKVSQLTVADRPVGSADGFAASAQEAALQALFLNAALPLDVAAQEDAYAAAVASAVNQAGSDLIKAAGTFTGSGESVMFFIKYRAVASFEEGKLAAFTVYSAPVGKELGTDDPYIMDTAALNEALAGQAMPLNPADYSAGDLPQADVTAVVLAINAAYENPVLNMPL